MQTINHFFEKYSELSQGRNLNALAACYAEHFIAAGPKGIMAFSNDEKFMEWLKGVQVFNQQSGMQAMKPIKNRYYASWGSVQFVNSYLER